MTPVTRYLRQASRKDGEPLNILTMATHEAYETGLAKTGHNFYSLELEGGKHWVRDYRNPPDNYHLIKTSTQKMSQDIPLYVGFDLALAQNVFGGFQVMNHISKLMNIPLIRLEHTLPHPQWSPKKTEELFKMRGKLNVYISEFSMAKWGDSLENNSVVIHHCIDTDVFENKPKTDKDYVLCVVNDWKNRDVFCGYSIWEEIKTKTDVEFRVVGDNPGLSKPAGSVENLVKEYQDAPIFLNTSTVSPVPTSLLEAMSCGCAVVSMATTMIPEIIQNGFNGFISNNPEELAAYIDVLRKDENLRRQMGEAARATILQKFNQERFVKEWNDVFYKVADSI